MVFLIQFLMTAVLWWYEFGSDGTKGHDSKLRSFDTVTITGMFLKLFTVYLFHLITYTDVDGAYRRLKFLRYNPDKFPANLYWSAFILT